MALKNTDVLPVDFVHGDASFARTIYHIEIPRKWSLENVLDPEFWRLQTRFKVNDILDLIAEDGTWDVTARVVQADRGGYLVLRLLRVWRADADAVQSDVTGEAHVELVPNSGWVLFSGDGSPIARFSTQDSANAALANLPEPAAEPAPGAVSAAATGAFIA